MFRASSVLRLKLRTGLTGYPLIPDAREQLISRYQAILSKLNNSTIPKDAVYRRRVDQLVNRNLAVLMNKHLDDDQCEEKIGMGQLEELIQLARNEEGLVADMEKWRPWEVSKDAQIRFRIEDLPDDSDAQKLLEYVGEAQPAKEPVTASNAAQA